MHRRRFLLTSLAGALALPLAAGVQQAASLPRPRECGSPEFLAIGRTVERLVKEEVLKAGLV